MYILYYALRILASATKHKNLKKTDLYRGWKMYLDTDIHKIGGAKKHIFKILYDLDKLSRHFKCFPDTYFRFGMFMKTWNDMNAMMSFLPQTAYGRTTINTTKHTILIDDKIIFHDIMSYYGFPVPERFFIYRDGEFRKGNNILSDSEVNSIINKINDRRIFVKRFTGGAASGISIFTRKPDGGYVDRRGETVSAQMIRKYYSKEGYIFERAIVQENELSQFNPDTVNTIRVLTHGKKVVAATIRFGGKGAFVDNTAAGGVAVDLDIESGKLGDFGMREYDLQHYYKHPGSGIAFADHKCSQWPQVKGLVEKVLKVMPYYKSVGFDVATTPSGPVIIEINTGAGIYLSQMGKTKGIADKFGY